jgi:hypothetical protein
MLLSLRLAAFTLLLLTLGLPPAFAATILYKREQVCNGHAALCTRQYGNTTFLGSHDSFAFSSNPLALSRTQEVDLEAQLKLGVRALQVQAHLRDGELHFCHASCYLFDGGLVEDYLRKVKTFLDANPNEVVTIIIANKIDTPVMSKWKAVFDKSQMNNLAYVPPQPVMTRRDWPTLGNMISSGKRVVVFMDKGFKGRKEANAEFMLPEFKMLWEDSYDPTDIAFPCKVERTAGPLAPREQLNLINHNLNANLLPVVGERGFLLPDRLNTPRTNSLDLILQHAAHCSKFVDDRNPNFVLVDYVNVGQGVLAVDKLNGF